MFGTKNSIEFVNILFHFINIGEDNTIATVITPSVNKGFIRIVTERFVIGVNHGFASHVHTAAFCTYYFHIFKFLFSLPLKPFRLRLKGLFYVRFKRGRQEQRARNRE